MTSEFFLTDHSGLPILWRIPEYMLARAVDYDLPALSDAPPLSLAQLTRNTAQEVCYCCFLFRAWPASAPSDACTFVADEVLVHLLASVLRALVQDHPGHLFVQNASRADRICRLGVVPVRHSRTRWLLALGSQLASAPAFSLYHPSSLMEYYCRFLPEPQTRLGSVEPPAAVPAALRFPLPSSVPTFLAPVAESNINASCSEGSALGVDEDDFSFVDEAADDWDYWAAFD
jgi:hypothetical protein